MGQFFADVLLNASHSSFVNCTAFAALEHKVNVGIDVVVFVNVVIPVLLSQFLVLVICPCHITHLTLYIFKLNFALSYVSTEDRANKDAHKEEEKCDYDCLGDLLDKTAWDLRVENGESVFSIPVKTHSDNLLHGFKKSHRIITITHGALYLFFLHIGVCRV